MGEKNLYVLLNVLAILGFIFSYVVLYKKISPYNFSLVENIILGGSIIVIYFFILLLEQDVFLIPLYLVTLIFLCRKSKYIWKIIILNASIFVIIEFVFALIILIFNNIFINVLQGFLNQLLICLVSCITIVFTSNLINRLNRKNRIILEYSNKKTKVVLGLFFITFITLNFYIDLRGKGLIYDNQQMDVIYTIIIYFVIIYIICMLYIYYVNGIKLKTSQFENLKEYTEKLENVYKDMRKFRHDYINVLNSISGYLDENDIEGLKEYFYKDIYEIDESMNKNKFKLGLLNNIRIMEIKGLLSSKIIKAQNMGLDVDIDIVEAIYRIEMQGIDLVRILGIIMDNAIEAAFLSKNKKIEIGIIKRNLITIIVISNSFKGEIFQVSKLFKEGYSTKGSGRGLGLSNVRHIINDYTNVTLDTVVNDNYFKQCIYIEAKENSV